MRRRRLSGQTGPGDPGGDVEGEKDSEGVRLRQVAERMGWEEGEAGPSDYATRSSAWRRGVQARREEEADADAGGMLDKHEDRNDGIDYPAVIPRSYGRTRPAHLLSAFVSPLLLPFLPSASAAPPRPRQPRYNPALTPPTQQPREDRQRKRINYPDAVNTPSLVPTSILIVEETSLPYVLSQGDDGKWRKDERGWLMYGRQGKAATSSASTAMQIDAASNTDSSTAASTTPTWAVAEALPSGWGQTSNRTDFYKVPLIAVASVILALAIVAGIIFVVFHRRKTHRRAKRRADRLRRKALAAAGLTEDDINGSAAQAVLDEKLEELNRQYRAKQKKKGSSTMVRRKIRKWNQGLRQRKGKGKEVDEDGEERTEVVGGEEKPVEPGSTSPDLGRTSTRSSQSPSVHGSTSSDEQRQTSPEQTSSTEHTSQSTQSPDIQPRSGSAPPPEAQAEQAEAGSAPYFPPAYRPASVRSFVLDRAGADAGPSRPARTEDDEDHPSAPTATEKVRAPGYYPAPVNEESEVALAVASRSDGKARMPVDFQEEERAEHIRHIATDDKRILEQMRLGSSAPLAPPIDSTANGADGASAPPSAPQIEVDDAGFERLALEEAGPSEPPGPVRDFEFDHLPVPPPPRLLQPSMRTFSDVKEQATPDERHLLPSAPPSVLPPVDHSAPSAPSAPPMDIDDDDHIAVSTPVPSVPSFDRHDSGREETFEGAPASSAPDMEPGDGLAEDEDEVEVEVEEFEPLARTGRETSRPSDGNGVGVVFLPKYEP